MSGARLIVVGASLGGLDALRRLLPALPEGHPPLVAVQHRLPSASSSLAHLLQKHVSTTVLEPEDGERLEPGRVYLAPADYHLLVEPGQVRLSVEEPVLHARPSIDLLLESAAYAYRDGLLALVLTGASRDGAEGAAAVRALGGTVAVQDPAGAESDILPRAALEYASPGLVLSLDGLAALLAGAGGPAAGGADRGR